MEFHIFGQHKDRTWSQIVCTFSGLDAATHAEEIVMQKIYPTVAIIAVEGTDAVPLFRVVRIFH